MTVFFSCLTGVLVPQQTPFEDAIASKCGAEAWYTEHQWFYGDSQWWRQGYCGLHSFLHRLPLQFSLLDRQLSSSHWRWEDHSALQTSHPHRVPYFVLHWNLQNHMSFPTVSCPGSASSGSAWWIMQASVEGRDGRRYWSWLSEEVVSGVA